MAQNKNMQLDIVIVSYRDWIHAEDAGINVRDLHIATELSKQPNIRKILFINRPVSLAEQIIRKNVGNAGRVSLLIPDVDIGFIVSTNIKTSMLRAFGFLT